MFSARVILDSQGCKSRLTTMEITYPRCIHAEMLRHRVFSRNTASSRAIPIAHVIEQVRTNPFIPLHWGAAQGGMQAYKEVSEEAQADASSAWILLSRLACKTAETMSNDLGLHKQVVNRLLEPWVWVTEIVTATQWSNFVHLRCHEAAEPHAQKIAYMMRDAYNASTPTRLKEFEWHIPFCPEDESLPIEDKLKIATGRLARVSYNKHLEERDYQKEIDLHDRLSNSGHWSPFEHCARNDDNHGPGAGGNFGDGWFQYRKFFQDECK